MAASWLRRISWLSVVALCVYAAGVFARFQYIIRFHHPRHYVTSDAITITTLAETLIDPSAQQQFFDTVWPPGMASVLALNLLFDPSLSSAGWMQFVLSLIVPLLIAHAGYLAWGKRAGLYALTASSFHFGFVHYAGFFLSEQLCQFATALAVWSTVLATTQSERRWMLIAGVGSGLAWGLAFAFRPNALPVAIFIGIWLALRWWRRRRAALVLVAGAALGLLLMVVPLSHRCTVLLGQFCPGASNGALNMAMGHAENAAGVIFRGKPGTRGDGFNWTPPARLHHGYSGTLEVPAVFYDTSGLLAWIGRRFVEDPVEFVIVSLGNALDLFRLEYWPDDYARLPPRWAEVLKQLFFAGVLIPALVAWALHVRAMIRRKPISDLDAALTAGVIGLLLLAAVSLGEARYRIPFDVVFILLAAGLFRREQSTALPSRRGVRAMILASTLITGAATLLLLAVAHPSIALAARLNRGMPKELGCRVELEVSKNEIAVREPTDFVLRRRRVCSELRVKLGEIAHQRTVEVSSDARDRYRLTFYRNGQPVAAKSWTTFPNSGVATVKLAVPAEALTGGYDELGLSALYGDGHYAIGHARLID